MRRVVTIPLGYLLLSLGLCGLLPRVGLAANADCALPGVFLCEDWENGVTGNYPWDPSAIACQGLTTLSAHSPTHSWRQHWNANQNSCGFMYGPEFSPRKEVYLRWYQTHTSGWNCNDPDHESKDFIVYGSRAPSSDWGTGFQLQVSDGVFGQCGFNFRTIRSIPPWDLTNFDQNQGTDVDFADNPTASYCLETRVKINDVGVSNGVVQAWVNDVLVMSYTGIRVTNGDDFFRMIQVTGSKDNCSPATSPCDGSQSFDRYLDDIVYSTQRIGCQGAATFNFTLGTTTVPGNQSVVQGSSTAANAFNVTSNGLGTPQSVALSASVAGGTPTGMTFTFGNVTANACTPTCSPNPTITTTTTGSTPAAVYTITITGNDAVDGIVHTVSYTVTVSSAAAPSPATNLHTTSVGTDQITLAWDASPSGGVTHYRLYRCLTVGGPGTTTACGAFVNVGNVLTYQDTSVVAISNYTYQVVAADAGGVESSREPTTPLAVATSSTGLAASYPGDVGLAGDARVVWAETFDEATMATLWARYTDVYDGGFPPVGGFMSFLTDLPASVGVANARSLLMTTNLAGGHSKAHLYKDLSGISAVTGATKLYLRLYVKYRGDSIGNNGSGVSITPGFGHTNAWFGGYAPALTFPFPRAGCQPSGGTSSGMISIGPEIHMPSRAIDAYLYWHAMTGDGTGCLGTGCTINQNTCFFGNKMMNNTMLTWTMDQWILVETMALLNTPATASNGELAIYTNGVKRFHNGPGFPLGTMVAGNFTPSTGGTPWPGYQWRSNSGLGFNWLWLQIFDGTSGSVNKIQYAQLYLSTAYVGPTVSGDLMAPGAPMGLRVVHP